MFQLLVHFQNAHSSRWGGWARSKLGAGNIVLTTTEVAGTELLEPSLLPPEVCISRKLQCEAQLEAESKHTDNEYNDPNRHRNSYTKYSPRLYLSQRFVCLFVQKGEIERQHPSVGWLPKWPPTARSQLCLSLPPEGKGTMQWAVVHCSPGASAETWFKTRAATLVHDAGYISSDFTCCTMRLAYSMYLNHLYITDRIEYDIKWYTNS